MYIYIHIYICISMSIDTWGRLELARVRLILETWKPSPYTGLRLRADGLPKMAH